MLNNSGRNSPDEEDEEVDAMRDEEDLDVDIEGLEAGATEDISIQGSLTMEQFSSPLVESQYKSTYAIVSNTGCLFFYQIIIILIKYWLNNFFSKVVFDNH